MKDQYIGDVNDASSRPACCALSLAPTTAAYTCAGCSPRLMVAQTEKIFTYLTDALRFRAFDPRLFDVLANLVSTDHRSVQAIEATQILPSAIFHTDILPDAVETVANSTSPRCGHVSIPAT